MRSRGIENPEAWVQPSSQFLAAQAFAAANLSALCSTPVLVGFGRLRWHPGPPSLPIRYPAYPPPR